MCVLFSVGYFCFQAEDGIRDLVRSRGLGDVYKRQVFDRDPRRRGVGLYNAESTAHGLFGDVWAHGGVHLSLIHI